MTEQDHDVNEMILHLINEYYSNYILSLSDQNFQHTLKQEIISLTLDTLSEVSDDIDYDYLEFIYDISLKYYNSNILPCRSSPISTIRKLKNNTFDIIDKKIDDVRACPQPEQRTNEWYEFRYNLITASNAYKALDTQSNINQLIVEKCKPLNILKYNPEMVNMDTPFHHGQKFEDVSIMVYEKKYSTKVEDFGCIKHNKYGFLGASPDGINIKRNNPRYGRMLEIKNIYNREIVAEPKKEYWIQMQLQMEVCNLNDCDFLETRFIEYDSFNSFVEDGEWTQTASNKQKGIYICFMINNRPTYEYCPLDYNKEEFILWEIQMNDKHNKANWFKNGYWYMDEFSCKLVLRNKFWFERAIPHIESVWNIIEKERVTGYEHRLPKSTKKYGNNNSSMIKGSGCLIVIKTD